MVCGFDCPQGSVRLRRRTGIQNAAFSPASPPTPKLQSYERGQTLNPTQTPILNREPLACKKCSHSSQTRDLANIGESEAQNPENLNPKHGKTQTSAQKTQKTCGHPNFSCRLSESQKSPILASTQAGSPGQAPPLPFDTLALQPKSRTRRNES